MQEESDGFLAPWLCLTLLDHRGLAVGCPRAAGLPTRRECIPTVGWGGVGRTRAGASGSPQEIHRLTVLFAALERPMHSAAPARARFIKHNVNKVAILRFVPLTNKHLKNHLSRAFLFN